MATRTRSEVEAGEDRPTERRANVSVCESSPGTTVFIESENTDSWIASDAITEVRR